MAMVFCLILLPALSGLVASFPTAILRPRAAPTSGVTIDSNITVGQSYIVQEGDTVTSLAEKFNVGVCDLARLNGLMNPDFIYTGEQFIIPAEPYLPDDYSCLNVNDTATTADCIYGGPHVYTTMPGDTIQKIANERYGITVDAILKYSPQTAYIAVNAPGPYDVLEAGQDVKIPLCADSRCIIQTYGFWYGTGPDLARTFQTTVGQIMSLNAGFNHSDGGIGPGAALTMPMNCTNLTSTITVL